jgi:hypothetical protein
MKRILLDILLILTLALVLALLNNALSPNRIVLFPSHTTSSTSGPGAGQA